MATDDNDLTLRIKGEADLDPLTRAVQVAEKKVTKEVSLMQKATILLGKKFDFVFKKTINPDLKKFMSAARASDKANSQMLRNLASGVSKQIELEKELKYATAERAGKIRELMAVQEDQIKESIQGLTKEKMALQKLVKAREHLNEMEQAKEEKQDRKFEEFVKYDAGEDIADGFKDALGSLSSRDLMGMGKGFVGAMGAAMKGAGSAMFRQGTRMQMDPKAGEGMQAFGKILSKIGPAVAGLAKAATAIGGLVAGLGMIVKVMMDIEAAGKEANKELLQGTSLMEDFYSAGADAGKAFKYTKKTVDDMRNSTAEIAMNLDFGTQAKEHREFLNTLKAEGIASDTMVKSFQRFGIAGNAVTDTMSSFADISKTGIAYSRLFGVSLNDIASMEAEMMTEMGSSLASVQLDFARMGKAAAEGGIASNKFFGIIRGVSADLNLYNNRIEDAVLMLGKLGKVMSPRNAQKFFSVAQEGLKNMSEEDRLRIGLILGEGEARKMATQEVKRHEMNLQGELLKQGAATADQLGSIFGKIQSGNQKTTAEGLNDLQGVINRLAPELRGQFQEALGTLKMDKNRMDKGGMMGIQEVMAKFSPAAAQEATVKAMEKYGGGKKLAEMTGVQAFAVRKLLNVSMEQYEAQAKMEGSIDNQKKSIVEALKKDASQRSEEESNAIDKLTQLGIINGDGTDETSKVMSAGWADIMDTMDEGDQKALAESQEQKNYAAETAQLTSTISDKMDTIIDGIFQYLYSIFEDLFDAVNSMIQALPRWLHFGKSDVTVNSKAEQRDLVNAIGKMTGPGAKMIQAAAKGADTKDVRGSLVSKLVPELEKSWKGMDKQLDDSVVALKQLQDTANDSSKSQEQRDAAAKKAAKIQREGQALLNKKTDDFNTIVGMLTEDQRKAAFKAAGASTALGADAPTAGQQTAIMEAAIWQLKETLSKGQLDTIAKLNAAGGGGAGAQSQAAIAAGNPGSQGAPAAAPPKPISEFLPGIPAAAPAAPPTPAKAQVSQKQSEEQHKEHIDAVQGEGEATRHALKTPSQGVALNKASVKQTLASPMEDAVYNGTSDALFEYFMYSKVGQDKIAMALQRGGTRKDIVGAVNKSLGKGGEGGMGGADAAVANVAKANADGGVVMRPAPGEAFASVAPGERIVPAGGGGGGKIVLELKGDMLKQIIRATAHDTIHEHESKKRLR